MHGPAPRGKAGGLLAALALALVSRRRLRADDSLRGARAGVVGVVLGLGVLVVSVAPRLLAAVLLAPG